MIRKEPIWRRKSENFDNMAPIWRNRQKTIAMKSDVSRNQCSYQPLTKNSLWNLSHHKCNCSTPGTSNLHKAVQRRRNNLMSNRRHSTKRPVKDTCRNNVFPTSTKRPTKTLKCNVRHAHERDVRSAQARSNRLRTHECDDRHAYKRNVQSSRAF